LNELDDDSTDTLSKGLVAHYTFDENDNATIVHDSSGNGNDGTEHGGVTYVDGVIGKAGSFDGVDDYVEILDKDILDLNNSFTISTWINPNTGYGTQEDNHIDIVSKWGDTGFGNAAYLLGINNNGQIIDYSYNGQDGNYFHGVDNIASHTWFHILIISNLSETKIYINGVLDSYSNNAKNPQNSQYNLFLGREPTGGNNYSGQIDDLRIYSRALNDSEIKELYDMGSQKRYSKKAYLIMRDYNSNPAYKEYETSFKKEVEKINNYLSELNISLDMQYGFNDINITKMKQYDLVLFHDFGWTEDVNEPVINKMIEIHHENIPIYFLGDDLAFQDSSNEKNEDWANLIGLNLSGNNSYNNTVSVSMEHAISNGVSNFNYYEDLDSTTAKDFAKVIFKDGAYSAVVAYSDSFGKVVSQLPKLDAGNESDASSHDLNNLKKLFQNSVRWLLEEIKGSDPF